MSEIETSQSVVIRTGVIQSGSPTSPQRIRIRDKMGTASGDNIIITLENGGTIDEMHRFVIDADFGAVDIYLDGANGFTLINNTKQEKPNVSTRVK